MDVSKAGGLPVPGGDRAAAPGVNEALPERRFAALLTESPPVATPARPDTGRCPFTTPILEVEGERAPTPPRAARPPAGPTPVEGPMWIRVADQALRSEARIDQMIAAGRRGQTFTASELLGLQIEVFRYSQTVEVISRTTDKIVSGLKQALGTQV